MLIVEYATSNYALVSDRKGYGKNSIVIGYDEDRLRKYSELLIYPNWTMDRVLNELREDIEIELALVFYRESEEMVKSIALQLIPYASANIHDPRKD